MAREMLPYSVASIISRDSAAILNVRAAQNMEIILLGKEARRAYAIGAV
jgi:hypothetical protein